MIDDEPAPYTDESGCYWSSYTAYVLTGLCGLCGCLNTALEEDFLAVLRQYDAVYEAGSVYINDLLPGNIRRSREYIELILHVLDNAGLLEHGTSIRGSWLTERGHACTLRLRMDAVGWPTQPPSSTRGGLRGHD